MAITPSKYAANGFTITTDIDASPVLSMVKTFEKNLGNANRLAINQAKSVVRNEVFGTFLRSLCFAGGVGWPEIYTDHLMAVMRANMHELVFGIGKANTNMFVLADFDFLGDYKDLEQGMHLNALLASGGEDNHPPGGGKGSGKHHGLNPHPARASLPYKGEPLMNDQERRTEFWERVIVDRDFSFELLLKRGKGNWTLEDHMSRMGYEVTELNEIYLQRTLVWGNKAPQWLLLENGQNTQPTINSVHFMYALTNVIECVLSTIYQSAIETLVELAESTGARANVAGQPYLPGAVGGKGRYVAYKELLEIKTGNYAACFGRF